MLEPCLRCVGQEQWQVADSEEVIVRAVGTAGGSVILELEASVRLHSILRDVHRQSIPLWEWSIADV